jgi:hypothetical protein
VTRPVVLKANLPTITARTFAEIISTACTTCGTYYVETHILIGCTEGAAGQTLQLSLSYRESIAHCPLLDINAS